MARFPEVQMPERPRGATEEKIDKVYVYLVQLSEQLNIIINILNKEGSGNGNKTEERH